MPVKAIAVRCVSSSEDLTNPGDYVFIAKREPRRTFERTEIQPPAGFWARLRWRFFGTKYATKEIIEMLWPEYDAIVINCPHCNQPLATTKQHRILSIDPLTIEAPIACVYLQSGQAPASFSIKDGQVMPA